MDVKYINPIFEATHSVLKNMVQLDAKRGDLQVKENHFMAQKVNASIGVTGDLKGFIYFSMQEDTALQIVERMAGMEIDNFNELASSAIGELANIIMGNSATNLSNMDYNCDITPPAISLGEHSQYSPNQKNFLVIPLHTDIGNFEINVLLEES